MTNAEFDKWATRHFPEGDSACGRALEIDRETVKALRIGETKNGAPYPVRNYIALACVAWSMGIREYTGRPRTASEAFESLRAARRPIAAALAAIDRASK